MNSAIGVPPEVIAQLHLFYRSSVTGRRDLGEKLVSSLNQIKDFKYSDEFSNRNVEILQAYLHALGVQLVFSDEHMTIKIYTDAMETFETEDAMYICTQKEFDELQEEAGVRRKYEENVVFVGTPDEYEEQIEKDLDALRNSKEKLVIDVSI